MSKNREKWSRPTRIFGRILRVFNKKLTPKHLFWLLFLPLWPNTKCLVKKEFVQFQICNCLVIYVKKRPKNFKRVLLRTKNPNEGTLTSHTSFEDRYKRFFANSSQIWCLHLLRSVFRYLFPIFFLIANVWKKSHFWCSETAIEKKFL